MSTSAPVTAEAAVRLYLSASFDQIWAAVARRDGRGLRAVLDQMATHGYLRTAIVIRDTLHAQDIGTWADVLFGDVDYLPDSDDGDEVTVTAIPVFQVAVTDRAGTARTFGAVLTTAGLLRIEIPPAFDRNLVAGLLDTCTQVFLTGRVDRTGPRTTLVLGKIEAADTEPAT